MAGLTDPLLILTKDFLIIILRLPTLPVFPCCHFYYYQVGFYQIIGWICCQIVPLKTDWGEMKKMMNMIWKVRCSVTTLDTELSTLQISHSLVSAHLKITTWLWLTALPAGYCYVNILTSHTSLTVLLPPHTISHSGQTERNCQYKLLSSLCFFSNLEDSWKVIKTHTQIHILLPWSQLKWPIRGPAIEKDIIYT